MMKLKSRIDFSIFDPEFYGVASGYTELPSAEIGERVDLFSAINPRPTIGKFSGCVEIEDKVVREDYISYFAKNVELESADEAKKLSSILADLLNLSIDR